MYKKEGEEMKRLIISLFVVCTLLIGNYGELEVMAQTSDVNVKMELAHVNRISAFKAQDGELYVDGYSYIRGVNIPNKSDIIQKLKFIDSSTGKQVLTFNLPNFYSTAASKDPNHGAGEYNYDWAKFKGSIDISSLPSGEYYIKIYTNAKGSKFDEIVTFHSSIQKFDLLVNNKLFRFERDKIKGRDTLKLMVSDYPVDSQKQYVQKVSNLSLSLGRLYVDGYSYVRGVNIPNKSDISQKLKFVDITTGNQVKTYNLENYYSTAATKDPNHGAGKYNYDWAKFKQWIDLEELPIGTYYMKLYTNAKGNKQDEIINIHSSAKDFLITTQTKAIQFERVVVGEKETFKVSVSNVGTSFFNVLRILADYFMDTQGWNNFEIQTSNDQIRIYDDMDDSSIWFSDFHNLTERNKENLDFILKRLFPAEHESVLKALNELVDGEQTYTFDGINCTLTSRSETGSKGIIVYSYIDDEEADFHYAAEYPYYPYEVNPNFTSYEVVDKLVNQSHWTKDKYGLVKKNPNDNYSYLASFRIVQSSITGKDFLLLIDRSEYRANRKEYDSIIKTIFPQEGQEIINILSMIKREENKVISKSGRKISIRRSEFDDFHVSLYID